MKSGVKPVRDSVELFAKLCLDGQQAGLSWITILRKQANYEAAFFGFDPHRLAQIQGGGTCDLYRSADAQQRHCAQSLKD